MDEPGHPHPTTMNHPGNTDTHGPHNDNGVSANSPADPGEIVAQQVDELDHGDSLLAWDPQEINQHAEPEGASDSGDNDSNYAVAAALNSYLQQHLATNNSGVTINTNTPQGVSTMVQALTFDGTMHTPLLDSIASMPPLSTEEASAMLAQAGMLVEEAEAILASAFVDGRLPRFPGPTREEAVRFVEGLERIDLETLAEDDRVSNLLRIYSPVSSKPGKLTRESS
ncbi:MAG: hypothetical protein Q9195_006495 [Heterodermia aff. obscurata]